MVTRTYSVAGVRLLVSQRLRDPFDGCLSAGNNPEISEAFGMEEE